MLFFKLIGRVVRKFLKHQIEVQFIQNMFHIQVAGKLNRRHHVVTIK